MSDQQQQQKLPLIYDAEEPSEESKRLDTIFDDLETKQPDTLDEASKGLIERIATFLGVLFGVTVLSNNFPPAYLKGNTIAKGMIILFPTYVPPQYKKDRSTKNERSFIGCLLISVLR